jgi:hypothetical protein
MPSKLWVPNPPQNGFEWPFPAATLLLRRGTADRGAGARSSAERAELPAWHANPGVRLNLELEHELGHDRESAAAVGLAMALPPAQIGHIDGEAASVTLTSETLAGLFGWPCGSTRTRVSEG